MSEMSDDRSGRCVSSCWGVTSAACLLWFVTACSSEGDSIFSGLNENEVNTNQSTESPLASPAFGPPETMQTAEISGEDTSGQNDSEQNTLGLTSPAQTSPGQNTSEQETDTPAEIGTIPTADLNVACDSPLMHSAMLTLTNYARAQGQNCGGSSFPAATALIWDNKLETAAAQHTSDMVNNNFFSHTGSNGLSVSDRVSAQGFDWRAVGENIAAGQQNTESAMSDWLDSAGHCRNIMDSGYARMAVACRVDPRSDFGVYWTAVYAR